MKTYAKPKFENAMQWHIIGHLGYAMQLFIDPKHCPVRNENIGRKYPIG